MVLEIVPEPIHEAVRLAHNAAGDLVRAGELDLGHFRRIGIGLRGQRPEIDIDEFVLLHAAVEIGTIAAVESERQRRGDAELLGQPPARRHQRGLAGARMPAAGIRQQPTGVIFLAAAPLQQDAALIVRNEDRECAMQPARAMHRRFSAGADGAIIFVDQDQSFFSHGLGIGRMSADDNETNVNARRVTSRVRRASRPWP